MKVELRYIVINGEIKDVQLIITQSDQLEETIKKSFLDVTLKVRTEELKNEGLEIAKRLNRNDIKFEVVKESS